VYARKAWILKKVLNNTFRTVEYEVNISESCCVFDIDIMQIILPEAEFKEFQPRR